MSGRGLGHSGGTIDKLESIPGFRVELQEAEFLTNVHWIGPVSYTHLDVYKRQAEDVGRLGEHLSLS